MAKALLETGDRELVEVSEAGYCCEVTGADDEQASPYDRIWGVGFTAAKADSNRNNWGENRLGKTIMNVRERLRKEG